MSRTHNLLPRRAMSALASAGLLAAGAGALIASASNASERPAGHALVLEGARSITAAT
ncbi:MAG: hypothetical protein JWM85_204, partial [Acidimicrobiaceae bacterium]|nr:hypothetical protein [Acidimicrobiaceae bacterium]